MKSTPKSFLRYDGVLWENMAFRRNTGWETTRLLQRPPEGSGDYRIELLDANGKLLVFVQPHVDFGVLCNTGAESRRTRIVCYVPMHDDARDLVFRRGDLIIDRADLAQRSPIVRITALERRKNGKVGLRWAAAHEKGRPLTYRVACIVDRSRGFLLAKDLKTQRFEAEFDSIPGSKDVRLGVLATDGLRSGYALSSVFQLPEKPPVVRIQNPDATLGHPAAQPLSLIGNAFDVAGATLPGKALVWRVDGEVVAQGKAIASLASPSSGKHRVTLQFVRANRVLAEDSVDLVVARPSERLKRYEMLKAHLDSGS